jgi:hypothetical protein
MIAEVEQPDKHSGKKNDLEQVADDFCRQRVNTRLITRVSQTDLKRISGADLTESP